MEGVIWATEKDVTGKIAPFNVVFNVQEQSYYGSLGWPLASHFAQPLMEQWRLEHAGQSGYEQEQQRLWLSRRFVLEDLVEMERQLHRFIEDVRRYAYRSQTPQAAYVRQRPSVHILTASSDADTLG